MAAIRKAGGAGKVKLKSAKERKLERKKEKESSSGPAGGGGGDLMSDLVGKLTMRRKGISGSKVKNKDSGMSTMDKISAMIPAPEKAQRAESHDRADWE